MEKIKIALIGIGNCSSSLIQGIYYYRDKDPQDTIGLMHHEIGGYKPEDIQVVAAFDIDERKVGVDVHQAIFSKPNCTTVFYPDVPPSGILVGMGKVLDSFADHMNDYDAENAFVLADKPEPTKEEVVQALKDSGAEILINYLPVGSEEATRFYADCALEANVAFINNIPVFIASDPVWAKRFEAKNIPIVGDDIKSQVGATITHRVLTDLFKKRGVKLERTYQLNTGGNTDFLNMLERKRLHSKKISKTESVQSQLDQRLASRDIHIGPSDYVPWQDDNKVAFIRMEGQGFGDVPLELELRLSVQDSPNSAGVVIDAVRCAKLGLDRGMAGPLEVPSAYFMKSPPRQMRDDVARLELELFLEDDQNSSLQAAGNCGSTVSSSKVGVAH